MKKNKKTGFNGCVRSCAVKIKKGATAFRKRMLVPRSHPNRSITDIEGHMKNISHLCAGSTFMYPPGERVYPETCCIMCMRPRCLHGERCVPGGQGAHELLKLNQSERRDVMGIRMEMHPSLVRFDRSYRAHMSRHEKDFAETEFEREFGVSTWDGILNDDDTFCAFLASL